MIHTLLRRIEDLGYAVSVHAMPGYTVLHAVRPGADGVPQVARVEGDDEEPLRRAACVAGGDGGAAAGGLAATSAVPAECGDGGPAEYHRRRAPRAPVSSRQGRQIDEWIAAR